MLVVLLENFIAKTRGFLVRISGCPSCYRYRKYHLEGRVCIECGKQTPFSDAS